MNNQNLYPRTKHALSAIRSSTHTHTHPRNHPPTHTTAIIKENETLRSTKALHSVEKEHQQHTFPSRGHPSRCSSVSAFLRLGAIRLRDIRLGDIRLCFPPSRGHPSRHHPSGGHPSQGHPSRWHPSQGRPSSGRRRPRQMARTDIPEMERHEDGGSIRFSFPSQGHPPLPFVSAIRLLQFNSSKYTLASIRVQFNCLRLKTRD